MPGIITSRTIRSGSVSATFASADGAAVGGDRLEAVEAQGRGHQMGDVLLVVDDQHPPLGRDSLWSWRIHSRGI